MEIEKKKRLLPYYRLYIDDKNKSSELGRGAFGIVYKGYLLNEDQGNKRKENQDEFFTNFDSNKHLYFEVACKTIPVTDSNTDILKEVEIMLNIESHENVLGLKGLYIPKSKIIKQLDPDSCFTRSIVVMEKMKTSLDNYMKDNERSFTIRQLILFKRQILDGMIYLQSQNIVHRDLATRNILI